MRIRSVSTATLFFMSLVWMFGLAGCTGASSSQRGDSEARAADEPGAAEAEDAEASEEAPAESFESVEELTNLLGTKVGEPPGCDGEWEEIAESPFSRGKPLLCADFRGPERWSDLAVIFAVDEGAELLGISVQTFFSGDAAAEEEFEDVTGRLLEECEGTAGYTRSMIVECSDFVLDARWRPGRQMPEVRYLFAVERDLLPRLKRGSRE